VVIKGLTVLLLEILEINQIINCGIIRRGSLKNTKDNKKE
jgi:hypothetical protein